jgi:type IV pilus assembly protein PilV
MLSRSPRSIESQRGGLLLEALIGILIFTLGVLGLVALQARAMTYSSDAQYRGEAAYLANAYVAKMWADDRANLNARYTTSGQPEYDALQTAVFRLLPGASSIANNPRVELIQPPAGASLLDARGDGSNITLTAGGSLVTIEIQWAIRRSENDSRPITDVHRYTMTSIIANN